MHCLHCARARPPPPTLRHQHQNLKHTVILLRKPKLCVFKRDRGGDGSLLPDPHTADATTPPHRSPAERAQNCSPHLSTIPAADIPPHAVVFAMRVSGFSAREGTGGSSFSLAIDGPPRLFSPAAVWWSPAIPFVLFSVCAAVAGSNSAGGLLVTAALSLVFAHDPRAVFVSSSTHLSCSELTTRPLLGPLTPSTTHHPKPFSISSHEHRDLRVPG